MAPRAIWTGAISFGLVNVPVRVYTAVHEHKLGFHLVHEPDDGPIGYQKICKVEERPVPNDEIVKAFEYAKGKIVHMTDEDLAAVRVEGQHTIDLETFVSYEEIDPTFFAHTYLVGPQEGAERPYALLVRAMEESELAGIGKFVMRSRQYLGCLRVRDGSLTLEQMYFADEIDPPEKILPGKLPTVPKRELDMALSLIKSFSGDWKPEAYRDTYHDALSEIVEQKRKGHEVHRVAEPEEEGPPDLMEALRQSLDRVQGGRRQTRNGSTRNGGRRDRGRSDVSRLTKEELQERARERDIPGRSKMSKQQLVRALSSR